MDICIISYLPEHELRDELVVTLGFEPHVQGLSDLALESQKFEGNNRLRHSRLTILEEDMVFRFGYYPDAS